MALGLIGLNGMRNTRGILHGGTVQMKSCKGEGKKVSWIVQAEMTIAVDWDPDLRDAPSRWP